MSYSVRLNKDEKRLAESYSKLHGVSIGQAMKEALFEKIEDEYDIAVAEKAHEEFIKDLTTYSHEELKEILGLE